MDTLWTPRESSYLGSFGSCHGHTVDPRESSYLGSFGSCHGHTVDPRESSYLGSFGSCHGHTVDPRESSYLGSFGSCHGHTVDPRESSYLGSFGSCHGHTVDPRERLLSWTHCGPQEEAPVMDTLWTPGRGSCHGHTVDPRKRLLSWTHCGPQGEAPVMDTLLDPQEEAPVMDTLWTPGRGSCHGHTVDPRRGSCHGHTVDPRERLLSWTHCGPQEEAPVMDTLWTPGRGSCHGHTVDPREEAPVMDTTVDPRERLLSWDTHVDPRERLLSWTHCGPQGEAPVMDTLWTPGRGSCHDTLWTPGRGSCHGHTVDPRERLLSWTHCGPQGEAPVMDTLWTPGRGSCHGHTVDPRERLLSWTTVDPRERLLSWTHCGPQGEAPVMDTLHFNLRMKRDTSLFAEDLMVDVGGQEVNYDTSHIYTGEIYGEKGTLSHGSVVDGMFEGFIQTYQGTFYVEPAERYLKDRDLPFHSVIYHEDDIDYPHKYGPEGGCADHSELHSEEASSDPVLLRKRRMTQIEKNTCQLFIQTDHLFFKYYKTREAVIAQINTTTDERDRSNPFRFANIGVEKFLELNSEQNHDDYCLAYVFTDRDFDDGVLGLAWVGAPAGSSGGICEKSKLYSDGKKKSLNTGIITVQNYASHVPPKVSHITFAHEDKKEKGNYIMYARATSGDKLNNNKFSICSVRNISQVLEKKRGSCFVESGQPICGNGLVEPGEECDCGYSDQCRDQCCYDAGQPDNRKCKLKPNKVCSPSQGPCCTPECVYKGRNEKCREESECAHQGMCNGGTAQCPTSEPKANFTACLSMLQFNF
ncbi:unnamed protein product [Coregonus sp. 'balchen']|nr:unnamed protein product [Coregonus sp. 'balchen']